MRPTCPCLLTAVLTALICLSGRLDALDGAIAPWLGALSEALGPLVGSRPPAPEIELTSRTMAPVAGVAVLALSLPFLHLPALAGVLALVAWACAIVVVELTLGSLFAIATSPSALLVAGLATFAVSVMLQRRSAEERAGAADALHRDLLMPMFAQTSTAAILTFDSDGLIRSCNRAAADLFEYPKAHLVGATFGRFLAVPERDHPRLFRRSDGIVRDLVARRRNGQRFEIQVSLSSVDLQGDKVRVAIIHDVSGIKADQELLALRDPATGLCNRTLFHDRIDQAILAAERASQHVAVLSIHLRLFALIGDTLGHAFADRLLQLLVDQIRQCLRRSDTLARIGASELGLLLPGLPEAEQAMTWASRIGDVTAQPFVAEDLEIDLQVNVGIAVYPQHGHERTELTRHAERAMFAARRAQKLAVVHGKPDDDQDARELSLRDDLHRAIEDGLLSLEFLPSVQLESERLVGVEALVRWSHPDRGPIPTDRFLRLAEEGGLIMPLTIRVLSLTLDQQRLWRARGWDLSVSINLAGSCLINPQFPSVLARLLDTWHGRAERLVFEITEMALAEHPSRALDTLNRLAAAGCQLSLDDFGTGSFSLSFLRKLPIHELKIDRSFVSTMRDDPDAAAVVRSAISLGGSLELRVVAEGVEDRETLEELRRLGCDQVQGFLVGQPMPTEAFGAWLQESGDERALERLVAKEPALG